MSDARFLRVAGDGVDGLLFAAILSFEGSQNDSLRLNATLARKREGELERFIRHVDWLGYGVWAVAGVSRQHRKVRTFDSSGQEWIGGLKTRRMICYECSTQNAQS